MNRSKQANSPPLDRFPPEYRNLILAHAKKKNSEPEKTVRSMLHQLGYRFRLHQANLPGNPDIVLKKHKTVIFVHDCFLHGHLGCKKNRPPETNLDFWQRKLDMVKQRDRLYREMLQTNGWKVLTLWECEIKNWEKVLEKLIHSLEHC